MKHEVLKTYVRTRAVSSLLARAGVRATTRAGGVQGRTVVVPQPCVASESAWCRARRQRQERRRAAGARDVVSAHTCGKLKVEGACIEQVGWHAYGKHPVLVLLQSRRGRERDGRLGCERVGRHPGEASTSMEMVTSKEKRVDVRAPPLRQRGRSASHGSRRALSTPSGRHRQVTTRDVDTLRCDLSLALHRGRASADWRTIHSTLCTSRSTHN